MPRICLWLGGRLVPGFFQFYVFWERTHGNGVEGYRGVKAREAQLSVRGSVGQIVCQHELAVQPDVDQQIPNGKAKFLYFSDFNGCWHFPSGRVSVLAIPGISYLKFFFWFVRTGINEVCVLEGRGLIESKGDRLVRCSSGVLVSTG